VQAQLERVEVQPVRRRDHNLSVDDAALRERTQERLVQLGKVAIERAQVAALDVDVGGGTEHDRAEAVPLRLEQEAVVGGQLVEQFG
jgi:hypothetical protein